MMEEMIGLEKQRARSVAEEYRSRSYEVIEEPSPQQLPDFLSKYRPDLLIRKGDEWIVVQVKSRSSLAKDPQVRDLAQVLEGKSGWSFELVLVAEGEQIRAPEGTRPFEKDDILQRTVAAQRLIDGGDYEAALLLAWSASEALVRLLIQEEGIQLDRPNPSYILDNAVINGVIARDDYRLLMTAMKYRNALVHGFKILDFDSALVKDLIRTTEGLLLLD